jgi:hypothetical protein
MAYWKFPRFSEVQFGETASTVVDINKKIDYFVCSSQKKQLY